MIAKYALLFALLGASQLYLAAISGLFGVMWAWSGVAFLTVAAAYGGIGAGVFGKRPDGSIPGVRRLLLLPYLLLTWLLWRLERLVSLEPHADEVAPGIWVGCRPVNDRLPEGTALVVDMTSELPASSVIRQRATYLCVPTLDTGAPTDEALEAALREVEKCSGPVLIHCASGHGRSALLAAAVLMRRGMAADADEAESLMRRARPGIKLKAAQKRLLNRISVFNRIEEAPRS